MSSLPRVEVRGRKESLLCQPKTTRKKTCPRLLTGLGHDRGTDRNRRASNHRSHLSFVPLEKLFPGRNDILVYSHPTTDTPHERRRPGSDPHWKIPVSQWQTVLDRVEQGEPLRKVAKDYHVSYEAIRRVLRTARKHRAG